MGVTIQGAVPDVPSKAMLLVHFTGRCPKCGGQGWVGVYGYDTPPEQEQCDVCYGDEVFWVDGIEYYDNRAHTHTDLVNDSRRRQGLSVCYGYFKLLRRG